MFDKVLTYLPLGQQPFLHFRSSRCLWGTPPADVAEGATDLPLTRSPAGVVLFGRRPAAAWGHPAVATQGQGTWPTQGLLALGGARRPSTRRAGGVQRQTAEEQFPNHWERCQGVVKQINKQTNKLLMKLGVLEDLDQIFMYTKFHSRQSSTH